VFFHLFQEVISEHVRKELLLHDMLSNRFVVVFIKVACRHEYCMLARKWWPLFLWNVL